MLLFTQKKNTRLTGVCPPAHPPPPFFFSLPLRKPENSFKNTKSSAFSLNYRVRVGEGTAWLPFCAAGCIFWWLLFHFNVLGSDFVLFYFIFSGLPSILDTFAAILSFSLGNCWGFLSSFVETSLPERCTDSTQRLEGAQILRKETLKIGGFPASGETLQFFVFFICEKISYSIIYYIFSFFYYEKLLHREGH